MVYVLALAQAFLTYVIIYWKKKTWDRSFIKLKTEQGNRTIASLYWIRQMFMSLNVNDKFKIFRKGVK